MRMCTVYMLCSSVCVTNNAPLREAEELSSTAPRYTILMTGLLAHKKNFGMQSYRHKWRITWARHLARITEWESIQNFTRKT
jgi:hypothetical protein